MRPAHAHNALVDVGPRHPLGLFVGRLHRLGRRGKLADQPFAHPGGLHHPMSAIAQRAFVQVRRQHARSGAANVQHDNQVVLFLAHRLGLTDPA